MKSRVIPSVQITPDKQLVIRFGEPGEKYEESPDTSTVSHPAF